jgi:hypothetical protein
MPAMGRRMAGVKKPSFFIVRHSAQVGGEKLGF